jgi:hypothetical protein
VTVEPTVVSVFPLPDPGLHEGSRTGVKKTMTQTTATRQPPAIASNLRLCSTAPSSTVKKKPLSRKKRIMLMEPFTGTAYQNGTRSDTCWNAGGWVVKSVQQAWCLHSQVPGQPGTEREAGEMPARSRHCNRGSARRRGDFGSQIPAVEEEQTLSAERAHSALMSRGADSVRPRHGPAGE